MARQVAGPTFSAIAASRVFADNGAAGAQAALTIAPQTAPTDSLEAGNIYVDATSKALLVYNGSAWLPAAGGYIPVSKQLLATSVSENIFIADRAYLVVGVRAVNTTAGTGGAATLDIRKCTGTQAPASGTTVLTGTFDLTTTANTVTTPALTTGAVLSLAAGDRLACVLSGTLTSLVANYEVFLQAA
jgi:hypothetical protein